jgi:hypothetical protein
MSAGGVRGCDRAAKENHVKRHIIAIAAMVMCLYGVVRSAAVGTVLGPLKLPRLDRRLCPAPSAIFLPLHGNTFVPKWGVQFSHRRIHVAALADG